MYCKKCGAPINRNCRYCFYCGAPVPERPYILRLLIELGKCAAYLLLFFAIQSLFIGLLSTAISIGSIFYSGGLSFGSLYNDILDLMAPYLHWALILSAIATMFVLWVFFRVRHKSLAIETGMRRMDLSYDTASGGVGFRVAAYLVIALCAAAVQLLLSVGCNFAYELIPSTREWFDSTGEAQQYLYGGSVIVQFVDVALLTPILEETIFRGLIFTRLRRVMPFVPAMLVSATVFGVMHGSIFAFIYAFLLGVLLACLYEKYNSLFPCIVFHFGFNAASYLPLPDSAAWQLVILIVSFIVAAAAAALLLTRSFDDADYGSIDGGGTDGDVHTAGGDIEAKAHDDV